MYKNIREIVGLLDCLPSFFGNVFKKKLRFGFAEKSLVPNPNFTEKKKHWPEPELLGFGRTLAEPEPKFAATLITGKFKKHVLKLNLRKCSFNLGFQVCRLKTLALSLWAD